jgi:hypothetical protein
LFEFLQFDFLLSIFTKRTAILWLGVVDTSSVSGPAAAHGNKRIKGAAARAGECSRFVSVVVVCLKAVFLLFDYTM